MPNLYDRVSALEDKLKELMSEDEDEDETEDE